MGGCGGAARAEQSPRPYSSVGVGVPDDPWEVTVVGKLHGAVKTAPYKAPVHAVL